MFAPIAIHLHKIDYLMKDVEAEYNKHMQSWIKAGREETEVDLFDSSL